MESFKISTRLTLRDYRKCLIGQYLKRRNVIILAIMAPVLAIGLSHHSIGSNDKDFWFIRVIYWVGLSMVGVILVCFLILGIGILLLIQKFKSDVNYQNNISYAFDDNEVSIEGTTMKSTIQWVHFIKRDERDKFLFLFLTKGSFLVIDKTLLTLVQLEFIRSKVKQSLPKSKCSELESELVNFENRTH